MMYTTILGQKEKVALKNGLVENLFKGYNTTNILNNEEIEILDSLKAKFKERTGQDLVILDDVLQDYNLELAGRTKKGIALFNDETETVILIDATVKKSFDLEEELEIFEEKLEEEKEKAKEKRKKELEREKEKAKKELKKKKKTGKPKEEKEEKTNSEKISEGKKIFEEALKEL